MNKILIYLIISMHYITALFGQQDTVYYDSTTGNYKIEYIDEDGLLNRQTYIPWNKINPSVICHIKYRTDFSTYHYEWKIKNEHDSEQNLNTFIVEFLDSNVSNISSSGWYSKRQHSIDGVGYSNRIWWSGDQGLEPNWEAQGFILSSKKLPTIGKTYFQGSGGSILSFSESPPPDKILKYIDKIDSFPFGFVKRSSLIPGKYLSKQSELLDTLILNCEKSYSLGWINNLNTKNKYNNYLVDTKTSLENADELHAIVMLQAIVNEVEADSGESLTSEAYALLKYNSEYLIQQLPEFDLVDFYERLIQIIDECYDEGEIDNKGIYNGLTKKVQNSKKKYEQGKIQVAANMLNAFQNELNAQKEKHLAEECFQLLNDYSAYIMDILDKNEN